jgi:hypothetical protein
MEPITLCGLVIVMFGLYVEFETAAKAVVTAICKSTLCAYADSNSTVRKPVYGKRRPLCVAKVSHY